MLKSHHLLNFLHRISQLFSDCSKHNHATSYHRTKLHNLIQHRTVDCILRQRLCFRNIECQSDSYWLKLWMIAYRFLLLYSIKLHHLRISLTTLKLWKVFHLNMLVLAHFILRLLAFAFIEILLNISYSQQLHTKSRMCLSLRKVHKMKQLGQYHILLHLGVCCCSIYWISEHWMMFLLLQTKSTFNLWLFKLKRFNQSNNKLCFRFWESFSILIKKHCLIFLVFIKKQFTWKLSIFDNLTKQVWISITKNHFLQLIQDWFKTCSLLWMNHILHQSHHIKNHLLLILLLGLELTLFLEAIPLAEQLFISLFQFKVILLTFYR